MKLWTPDHGHRKSSSCEPSAPEGELKSSNVFEFRFILSEIGVNSYAAIFTGMDRRHKLVPDWPCKCSPEIWDIPCHKIGQGHLGVMVIQTL